MKELVSTIVKSMVDNPDDITIDEIEGDNTTVIELRVATEDMGKVIGKQGRTARAMRTLLNAATNKTNKRTVLEILE